MCLLLNAFKVLYTHLAAQHANHAIQQRHVLCSTLLVLCALGRASVRQLQLRFLEAPDGVCL